MTKIELVVEEEDSKVKIVSNYQHLGAWHTKVWAESTTIEKALKQLSQNLKKIENNVEKTGDEYLRKVVVWDRPFAGAKIIGEYDFIDYP